MKKLFVLILILFVMAALAACGEDVDLPVVLEIGATPTPEPAPPIVDAAFDEDEDETAPRALSVIPSIEINVIGDITATLTNVYDFYVWQAGDIGVYMSRQATVAFNVNAVLANGRTLLSAGTAYPIEYIAPGGFAVFYIVWDANDFVHKFVPLGEIAAQYHPGTFFQLTDVHHEYAAFNCGFDDCDHPDTLEGYFQCELSPLRGHLRALAVPTPAEIIPSITIRSPGIFTGEEVTILITFTHVFDTISHGDACNMSGRSFYLLPEGSVSFNRDVELFLNYPDDFVLVRAGETFYVYGHENFGFRYGTFYHDEMPYFTVLSFGFHVVGESDRRPVVFDMSHREDYGPWMDIFSVSANAVR